MFDYEHEEDARNSLNPKLVVEILGVSEWDGRGRVNSYPGGFLLVTHTGCTYYVSVSSLHERDEWMVHLRRGLECVFANPEVAPFKPSKIIQQRPAAIGNATCPRTNNLVNNYSPFCRSCGRHFYSSDLVMETAVLLQFGSEELEKVCIDCKQSQIIVLWLKTMNYVHTMDLHEMTDMVVKDVSKFKASFKLRRRLSQRLDMAAELYEAGNLNSEEFEELRQVDHAYRRELIHEECEKLKTAIEAFGEDMQTIINVLMDSSLYDTGGRNAYYRIILRILEIADFAPDLVDFYFPQLYAVYLQQSAIRTYESLVKIDALQQAFLVLSQKFPSFGMKLAWNLLATVGDYEEKKVLQVQYAAAAALLLQFELVNIGIISSIADIPSSKTLSKILRPAVHQQQEIGYEVSILFLVRRKLQEAYDGEEYSRLQRNVSLYGRDHPDHINLPIVTLANGNEVIDKLKLRVFPKSAVFPGTNSDCSCVELLYQLGVKQQIDAMSASSSSRGDEKNLSEHQVGADQSDGEVEDASRHSKAASEVSSSSATSSTSALAYVQTWEGFSEQLDFINNLNDLVESLRFLDRSIRTETLRKELSKWNQTMLSSGANVPSGLIRQGNKAALSETPNISSGSSKNSTQLQQDRLSNSHKSHSAADLGQLDASSTHSGYSTASGSHKSNSSNNVPRITLGWDPITIAGEPHYKITRIMTEECRVFRTKARAPSLVICEIMRDDVFQQYGGQVIFGGSVVKSQEDYGLAIDDGSSSSDVVKHDHLLTNSDKFNTHHDKKNTLTHKPPLHHGKGNIGKPSAHNITRTAPHAVLPATRARGDSMDGHVVNNNSVSTIAISNINSFGTGSECGDPIEGSKHTFESISQSIRDVDSLLVDSSYHSAMIAELQKVDTSKSNDVTQNHSSPCVKINGSMKDGGEPHLTFSDMQLDGNTYDSSPSPNNAVTPDGLGLRRNSASFHLPKWRRNSSFLPANRLSTSTEGILRSSQVSQITTNSIHGSTDCSVSPSTTVSSSSNVHNARRNSEVVSSTSTHQRSSARLSTNKLTSSLIKSVSTPNIASQLSAEFEIEGSYGDQDNGSESLRVTEFEKHGHHHGLHFVEEVPSGDKVGVPNQQQVLSSAQRLLTQGLIDQREYEQLIRSDRQFRDESARDEAMITKTRVESAFGETFQSKKERLLSDRKRWLVAEGLLTGGKTVSVVGHGDDESWPIFDLRAFIVKTNDDLRQEICCLQLMKVCKEIFDYFGLHDMLFLKPYRIISTGNNSGIVEVLPDAISLDALKRSNGFTTLKDYFQVTYSTSKERLQRAKRNFMKSLAAYSLFSYILLIKDRHNGNLLIDSEGHILHIDFGFILSIAPGGSFSIETAPFKLTDEMVDLLGGLDSPLFGDFVTAFTKGFIALQANCENILSAITILSQNSTFPCFQGKSTQQILEKLRGRFRSELNVNDAVKHCLDLITNSYGHYGTKQYDTFQYYTNGILP